MLIFDRLKKNDPQLRLLALVVFVGMFLLFAGLWWVQVALRMTIRRTSKRQILPAPSALRPCADEILDLQRTGAFRRRITVPPTTSASISKICASSSTDAHNNSAGQAGPPAARERRDGRTGEKPGPQAHQTGTARIRLEQRGPIKAALQAEEDCVAAVRERATSSRKSVRRLRSHRSATPDPHKVSTSPHTMRHRVALLAYTRRGSNLKPVQTARFRERFGGSLGADLEIQSTRTYPFGRSCFPRARLSASRRQLSGKARKRFLLSLAGLSRRRSASRGHRPATARARGRESLCW